MEKTRSKLPDEIKESVCEVSKVEILNIRLSRKIGVVLKIGDLYYKYNFTSTKVREQAEEKESIRYVLGHHLCNTCDFTRGGKLCPKIADLSVETCRKYNKKEVNAMKESKRIEKYDFIIKGIECFNSHKEYFVVAKCTRYQAHVGNRNNIEDVNS